MVASLKERFTAIELVGQPSSRSPTEEQAKSPILVRRSKKDNLAYIRILNFDSEDLSLHLGRELEPVADCNGFVLDVRPNRGGMIEQCLECCEFFIEAGTLCTIERRMPDGWRKDVRSLVVDEGLVVITRGDEQQNKRFDRFAPIMHNKPCLILISEFTASAAEILAEALLENARARKLFCKSVGRRSRGKGTVQHFEPIADGVLLSITRGRFLSASGQWFGDAGQTVSNGIEPDIPVLDDTGPEALQVAFDTLRQWLAQ
jgi:carboxyl-terminal processing protease